MSTQQKHKTQSSKDQEKVALIGVILIILIVLGIGVASFYAGKNQGSRKKSEALIVNISKPSTPMILGDQINNWNGNIIAIDDSKIKFNVSYTDQDNTIKTKTITALVQSSTQLLKWDLTKPSTVDRPGSSKELISMNQLAVGQRVLVQAASDPNDQNEVAATAITVLVTPGT
jgi:hypothetical protein